MAAKTLEAPARLRRNHFLLLCIALWAGAGRANAAEPFVVIVNANNPVAALTRRQASDLFFKKTALWSDGTKVHPVDLAETVFSREEFSRRVHGKSTTSVKSYWQKMIFSGQGVPPPEKAAPQEVVRFVRTHPGGIGYVPPDTDLGEGIKVVSLKP